MRGEYEREVWGEKNKNAEKEVNKIMEEEEEGKKIKKGIKKIIWSKKRGRKRVYIRSYNRHEYCNSRRVKHDKTFYTQGRQ